MYLSRQGTRNVADYYVRNVYPHPKFVSIFLLKDSRCWQFPKCAECGRFRFPATRCNSSGIFWQMSRSDRLRSNYTELVPRDMSIVIHRAQNDTIDSGCETRRMRHCRISKLSFRSNPRTFGELPNGYAFPRVVSQSKNISPAS